MIDMLMKGRKVIPIKSKISLFFPTLFHPRCPRALHSEGYSCLHHCLPHTVMKSLTDGINGNVSLPLFNALCVNASPKIVSENKLISELFDSFNLLMCTTLSC